MLGWGGGGAQGMHAQGGAGEHLQFVCMDWTWTNCMVHKRAHSVYARTLHVSAM